MNDIKCTHCSLSFPKDMMIEDGDNYFCCKGCQGVYHLLQDEDLDSFYTKKGSNRLNQPIALNEDSSNFDLETFSNVYIKTTQDGFNKIDLIIEGIHCSACIWLNEKILYKLDGIVDININFTNHKATIVWDNDIVSLSKIIFAIRSIGYDAYPYKISDTNQTKTKQKRDYFSYLSVAIFSTINIMMIDVAKYSGYLKSIDENTLYIIHIAEFIVATPVLFYSGSIFFKGAYYALKNKNINMDFLVSFGATLTYIYSLYVLLGGKGESYFDSVVMIITFVLIGKYLEVLGKNNALDTIDKIKAHIPYEATIIKNNEKTIVPIEQIQIDDTIELKMGQTASVDGILLSNSAIFNQSNITGESLDINKIKDETIYSGTTNVGDVILYKATKIYEESTFHNIITTLENSLNSKPKIEDFTNKISQQFSLAILLVAIATFILWYYNTNNFETSMIIAISVVVIACPCALALATPIASIVGISYLNEKGLLLKEAKHIETFTKIDTIVFDKTGTLTKGELKVIDTITTDIISNEKINILYSIVSSSTHLVSIAIFKYLKENYSDLELVDIKNIEQIPALGIEADYQNQHIFCGKNEINTKDTNFIFKIDDKIVASFILEDTLRDDAKRTIDYLKEQDIDIYICSGDNHSSVNNIANKLDIKKFQSDMTPIQKSNFIKKLQSSNKVVAMVGDGLNDVIALSTADISISLSSGSDISIGVSDVVILNNSLEALKQSFIITKRTYKFIKQNLSISFLYNIITIPIAIAGYVVPLLAALSMSISSLLVVSNSLRIKKK